MRIGERNGFVAKLRMNRRSVRGELWLVRFGIENSNDDNATLCRIGYDLRADLV